MTDPLFSEYVVFSTHPGVPGTDVRPGNLVGADTGRLYAIRPGHWREPQMYYGTVPEVLFDASAESDVFLQGLALLANQQRDAALAANPVSRTVAEEEARIVAVNCLVVLESLRNEAATAGSAWSEKSIASRILKETAAFFNYPLSASPLPQASRTSANPRLSVDAAEDMAVSMEGSHDVRWVNHYDDQSAGSHMSREDADRIAAINEQGGHKRIACIKNVFLTGDGLNKEVAAPVPQAQEAGSVVDPGRALKDALFACLKAGSQCQEYGGVLAGDGKSAWVRFTIEDASAHVARPREEVQASGGDEAGDYPIVMETAKAEYRKLVDYFRGERYSRFGYDGDVCGDSPADTAIKAMRALDKRLRSSSRTEDEAGNVVVPTYGWEGTIKAVSDPNGKRWRIVGQNFEMQPVGEISAAEAEDLCKQLVRDHEKVHYGTTSAVAPGSFGDKGELRIWLEPGFYELKGWPTSSTTVAAPVLQAQEAKAGGSGSLDPSIPASDHLTYLEAFIESCAPNEAVRADAKRAVSLVHAALRASTPSQETGPVGSETLASPAETGIAARLTEDDVFAWLCRKYVQRQDDRQKSMGLQYTTAETHDLAKEIVRYFDRAGLLTPSPKDTPSAAPVDEEGR